MSCKVLNGLVVRRIDQFTINSFQTDELLDKTKYDAAD